MEEDGFQEVLKAIGKYVIVLLRQGS